MKKEEDTKEFQSHFNPNQEEPKREINNEKKDAIINYIVTVVIAILFIVFFSAWIIRLWKLFLVIIK